MVASASVVLRADNSNPTVEIAPYVNGTANRADYPGHNLNDPIEITNTHVIAGIVGTGAAIGCGVLVHRTGGGTGFYKTGVLSVRCIPRS